MTLVLVLIDNYISVLYRFRDIITIFQNLQRSRDSQHITIFVGQSITHSLVLIRINLNTKFGMSSFTRSKFMIGPKNLTRRPASADRTARR